MGKNIVAWPEEPLHDRFSRARALLNIHGMLSEAENEKVAARIKKSRGRLEKAIAEVDRAAGNGSGDANG